MDLDRLYDEVSSLVDEECFSKLYDYAVKEPHNASLLDTHRLKDTENRFKLNFDIASRFSDDKDDN
jgi:hypothetical protein